ncbi:hypothetical protein N2152v2_003313 [Parachlorella kessleri]
MNMLILVVAFAGAGAATFRNDGDASPTNVASECCQPAVLHSETTGVPGSKQSLGYGLNGMQHDWSMEQVALGRGVRAPSSGMKRRAEADMYEVTGQSAATCSPTKQQKTQGQQRQQGLFTARKSVRKPKEHSFLYQFNTNKAAAIDVLTVIAQLPVLVPDLVKPDRKMHYVKAALVDLVNPSELQQAQLCTGLGVERGTLPTGSCAQRVVELSLAPMLDSQLQDGAPIVRLIEVDSRLKQVSECPFFSWGDGEPGQLVSLTQRQVDFRLRYLQFLCERYGRLSKLAPPSPAAFVCRLGRFGSLQGKQQWCSVTFSKAAAEEQIGATSS